MKVQIDMREDVFQKSPAELMKKLGGYELPIDYLDFNFEFHPRYKEQGSNALVYPKEGGILSCFKVFRFPTKGFPAGIALELLGVIKKLILNSLKLATTAPFCYLIGTLVILPKKVRIRALYYILEKFIEIADWALNRWYLKPERMCSSVREVYIQTEAWINKKYDNKEKEIWLKILLIACMIIEYDSAYRYRFQDILVEIDKNLLKKSPIEEIERLNQILIHRESVGGVNPDKYKPFIKALKWLFRLKRKTAGNFIDIICSWDLMRVTWDEFRLTDFTQDILVGDRQRIGFDYGDWYHILNSDTYGYGGIPFHARYSLRRKIDTQWADQLVNKGIIKK